jgi:TolB-like protein
MRQDHYKILLPLLIFIVCIFFGLIQPMTSQAKTPKKVAVLPFTMNADRDLTFLQTGILDMLATRLEWKDEVEILEKGPVAKKFAEFKPPLNTEKALTIGKALGVDYVILGSLTIFGESVSIDAKILDVAKSQELLSAFNQTKGMDAVIPTINQFAMDINAKIMGRVVRPPVYATPQGTYERQGSLIRLKGADAPKVAHAQNFYVEITGMDVGDVDGDGKKDVVFITRDKVHVLMWQGKTFAKRMGIKGKWSPYYVYVNVKDLDANGKAEIYVSSLGEADASSYVFEWDGQRLREIARESGFMRVIDIPGRGPTLIGQKRETDGSYSGNVVILKREGKNITRGEQLPLPHRASVFNFALIDLERDRELDCVLFNPLEFLEVYDQAGEKRWMSEESFGGSLTSMEDKSYTGDTMTGRFVFFPSPIYVTDIDEDGQKEIVTCKNISKILGLSEKLRWFTSGKVHFLTWDGAGLSSEWTSQKVSGAIIGYAVADIDGDNQKELVIAAVTTQEKIIGKARSSILFYDLDLE